MARLCLWKGLVRWLTAIQCFQVPLLCMSQVLGSVCSAGSHPGLRVTYRVEDSCCCDSSSPESRSDLVLRVLSGSVPAPLTTSLAFLQQAHRLVMTLQPIN